MVADIERSPYGYSVWVPQFFFRRCSESYLSCNDYFHCTGRAACPSGVCISPSVLCFRCCSCKDMVLLGGLLRLDSRHHSFFLFIYFLYFANALLVYYCWFVCELPFSHRRGDFSLGLGEFQGLAKIVQISVFLVAILCFYFLSNVLMYCPDGNGVFLLLSSCYDGKVSAILLCSLWLCCPGLFVCFL